MTHREIANANAESGLNCCQSVFVSYAEELGISRDTALRLCSGFGSGVSCGETCGAVTGAVMAIGMKAGFTEPSPEAKKEIKLAAQKFIAAFKEKHGAIRCKELIGYNISESEENYRRAIEENAFRKVCRPLICDSAEMLEDYLPTLDESR